MGSLELLMALDTYVYVTELHPHIGSLSYLLFLPIATFLGNLFSLVSCFEPPGVKVLSIKCEIEDSQNFYVMADFRAKPQDIESETIEFHLN